MPILMTQTDERLDLDQPITLHPIDPLPTASNQLADVLYDDDPTNTQSRPAYYDGAEWVDMGYGFHKEPGAVPGTDHKEMISFEAFGISSTAILTPFGFAAMRSDGSGKVVAVTDTTNNQFANGGFVWARPTAAEGPRWDFSMNEVDTGGPTGFGGGVLHLDFYNNVGVDPEPVMEASREDGGRIQMNVNFRLPVYADIFGGTGPVNPIQGDMVFDQSTGQSYVFDGGGWI